MAPALSLVVSVAIVLSCVGYRRRDADSKHTHREMEQAPTIVGEGKTCGPVLPPPNSSPQCEEGLLCDTKDKQGGKGTCIKSPSSGDVQKDEKVASASAPAEEDGKGKEGGAGEEPKAGEDASASAPAEKEGKGEEAGAVDEQKAPAEDDGKGKEAGAVDEQKGQENASAKAPAEDDGKGKEAGAGDEPKGASKDGKGSDSGATSLSCWFHVVNAAMVFATFALGTH
eukprot:TRINITY_DN11686_c0_g2_i1.p1 TRINITY_DN11686_c0_g2~~TRINITY_DN11686_c0_g2_i1.p1  ORF type:complete len:227 (+),score=41.17 TRINITY_DN11686_c0_g2_i1:81-761(+)